MKISIDTKEDSHEDIRKAIRMLQNIVGDMQEIFTNQPISSEASSQTANPFINIFGDNSIDSQPAPAPETMPAEQSPEPGAAEAKETEETSQSAEDLFAELFSEEELKKMDKVKNDEEDEGEIKPKSKRPSIELY